MTPATARKLRRLCTTMLALGLGACLAWGVEQVPRTPAQKFLHMDKACGAVGVWTGSTYAYILPSRTGRDVALVNAGSDPKGSALLQALATLQRSADDVRLILLTDGQAAHRAAVSQFTQAEVVVGLADLSLAAGTRAPRALVPRLLARVRPRPAPPGRLVTVAAGSLLQAGELVIETVSLPGYTPGSMAYACENTAFVGRSLRLGAAPMQVWSWLFSESPASNRRALPRLRDVRPTQVADSHYGVAPFGEGGGA